MWFTMWSLSGRLLLSRPKKMIDLLDQREPISSLTMIYSPLKPAYQHGSHASQTRQNVLIHWLFAEFSELLAHIVDVTVHLISPAATQDLWVLVPITTARMRPTRQAKNFYCFTKTYVRQAKNCPPQLCKKYKKHRSMHITGRGSTG